MKYLGPNACEEALGMGRLQTLRVSSAAWGRLAALRERARSAGVPVQREPEEGLDRRAGGGRHQGAVGEGAEVALTDMPELLQRLRGRGDDGLVLLLDGVTDPHNFGAALRSAAAAAADGVVFPERRSAKINETVIRASAGTAGRVPLVRVVNLGRAIDELKDAGLWVFGMSASTEGTADYLDERFDRASAVVLGSEGEGLHLKIRERCDALLRIGMPGGTDSLSVSAAAAVVLFRAVARREKKC